MVLIKSISGVRGIIYEDDSKGLSSKEIIHCVNQFCLWIEMLDFSHLEKYKENSPLVVGRDGRKSGKKISKIIIHLLVCKGFNVMDLGLTTTPSVQLAIINENCLGGIMISASHNPINWNGLKLLNWKGEFLSKKESLDLFGMESDNNHKDYNFNEVLDKSGSMLSIVDYKERHIESILNLNDVDVQRIKSKKFKIVVDGINSSGGIFVPFLLKKLGVSVVELNCTPDGNFSHKPEPLPENLRALSHKVKEVRADLGVAVDPDVDRLVLVCENGSFFGEEYTIVAIVKYILSKHPKSSVVSNLSTTRAVTDIAKELGCKHFESPVGEINVIELMKEKKSIIGGEGSGGIIFSLSHYGRDALVGIALFLSYLSNIGLSAKELKSLLPHYFMLKEKLLLKSDSEFNFENFIRAQVLSCKSKGQKFSLIDGIKIYYNCGSWAHIRNSNTEPVVRLIIESKDEDKILEIKKSLIIDINNYLK